GRSISADINLCLLKFWLSTCVVKHESCSSKRTDSGQPEYSIDTYTRTLIREPGAAQYAALSYVWGGPEVPQLNLNSLKELEPECQMWLLIKYWERLPNTVKDAIALCESLSIQQLWVYSLCILQGSRPSESLLCDTRLARQMFLVYREAYLTIVAAGGKDSWAGLPGFNGRTRKVNQQIVQLDRAQLSVVLPRQPEAIASSVWNTRAWT
ncbi:heterokaryon incompatibility protein-domain-containing protein, partial [Immersiella caudata]